MGLIIIIKNNINISDIKKKWFEVDSVKMYGMK